MNDAGSRISSVPVSDSVADHDRLRNQAELEEAVGDCLLGIDDAVRHRTDREGRAICRDDLDFERNAGHRGQRRRDLGAVRLGPAAASASPLMTSLVCWTLALAKSRLAR